jgi:hypothetical protein
MQNNRRVISYQSECTYCKQELVDCLLVAAPAVPDLLLCAKHLSFSANEALAPSGSAQALCVCVLLRIGAAPGAICGAAPICTLWMGEETSVQT